MVNVRRQRISESIEEILQKEFYEFKEIVRDIDTCNIAGFVEEVIKDLPCDKYIREVEGLFRGMARIEIEYRKRHNS